LSEIEVCNVTVLISMTSKLQRIASYTEKRREITMCLENEEADEAVSGFKIRKGDRLYGTYVQQVCTVRLYGTNSKKLHYYLLLPISYYAHLWSPKGINKSIGFPRLHGSYITNKLLKY
jgi:hypothetical protein